MELAKFLFTSNFRLIFFFFFLLCLGISFGEIKKKIISIQSSFGPSNSVSSIYPLLKKETRSYFHSQETVGSKIEDGSSKSSGINISNWIPLIKIPATVLTQVSFTTPNVGFIAAEQGKIYRTTDGKTFQNVLDRQFPYYYYGIHTFNTKQVLASGFDDIHGSGIITLSEDGGETWTPHDIIDKEKWLGSMEWNQNVGIVLTFSEGNTYRVSRSKELKWNLVDSHSTGWLAEGRFTFQNDTVFLSGYQDCISHNSGMNYTCAQSASPYGDGGNWFLNSSVGFVGGGTISPQVQGYIYRTLDQGKTWTLLKRTPYPIRSIIFVNEKIGFAVGGNYFSTVGGIWISKDGGETWDLDLDTSSEIKGIDFIYDSEKKEVSIFCGGSAQSGATIYKNVIQL